MSSRDKILARRAGFIAAAMTSLAGCSSSDPGPQPEVVDTGAQACLSADATFDTGTTFDTGSEPCLTAPFDSGTPDTDDTGPVDSTTETAIDTGPMPCLAPPPGDSG